MSDLPQPKVPNILITGTPGVGKSSLAKAISEATPLTHIDVGKIVKEEGFVEGKDEKFDTLIPDEDRLLDHLEPLMMEGGKVVDYHSSELFPERWFSLVIVLRAGTACLFDRLAARGYSEVKRQENLDCEIFGIPSEEAKSSYPSEIVREAQNETIEQMEATVENVEAWCRERGIRQ
ncbi:Adenylate kinase isoenzyme 6-like protein [Diplonema papillatum]|nr:Adenylate kinase isoenzyme 6-like protein [Diplonema papillatum]